MSDERITDAELANMHKAWLASGALRVARALGELIELRGKNADLEAELLEMTEIAVSRASVGTLSEIRTRITRLTLRGDLPNDAWSELCRLDSDMSEMGVPSAVSKEHA